MASGSGSNNPWQFVPPPLSAVPIVTPEQALQTAREFKKLQETLEERTRTGLQNFEKLQKMRRLVEEGRRAERTLQDLGLGSSITPLAPLNSSALVPVSNQHPHAGAMFSSFCDTTSQMQPSTMSMYPQPVVGMQAHQTSDAYITEFNPSQQSRPQAMKTSLTVHNPSPYVDNSQQNNNWEYFGNPATSTHNQVSNTNKQNRQYQSQQQSIYQGTQRQQYHIPPAPSFQTPPSSAASPFAQHPMTQNTSYQNLQTNQKSSTEGVSSRVGNQKQYIPVQPYTINVQTQESVYSSLMSDYWGKSSSSTLAGALGEYSAPASSASQGGNTISSQSFQSAPTQEVNSSNQTRANTTSTAGTVSNSPIGLNPQNALQSRYQTSYSAGPTIPDPLILSTPAINDSHAKAREVLHSLEQVPVNVARQTLQKHTSLQHQVSGFSLNEEGGMQTERQQVGTETQWFKVPGYGPHTFLHKQGAIPNVVHSNVIKPVGPSSTVPIYDGVQHRDSTVSNVTKTGPQIPPVSLKEKDSQKAAISLQPTRQDSLTSILNQAYIPEASSVVPKVTSDVSSSVSASIKPKMSKKRQDNFSPAIVSRPISYRPSPSVLSMQGMHMNRSNILRDVIRALAPLSMGAKRKASGSPESDDSNPVTKKQVLDTVSSDANDKVLSIQSISTATIDLTEVEAPEKIGEYTTKSNITETDKEVETPVGIIPSVSIDGENGPGADKLTEGPLLNCSESDPMKTDNPIDIIDVGIENESQLDNGLHIDVDLLEPQEQDKHSGDPEKDLAQSDFGAQEDVIDSTREAVVPDSNTESRASSTDRAGFESNLDQKEAPDDPLFLPSPPSSPEPVVIQSRKSSKIKWKPSKPLEIYVEVPSLSPALKKRYQTVETETNGSKSLHEQFGRASESEDPRGQEVLSAEQEEQRKQANQAFQLAASRLNKRPCLWTDCLFIGNSAENLRKHVQEHAEEMPESERVFPCSWDNCARRFKKREALIQHSQNHVNRHIICAYKGCDQTYNNRFDYLNHVLKNHPEGSKRKSPVTPFTHINKEVPPLGKMNTFNNVHLPVRNRRMTKERRNVLGPWVLKNCFGDADLKVPKTNLRNQLRRGESHFVGDLPHQHDRYNFLESWTATYPSSCADLDSTRATQDIIEGVVLLPDTEKPSGPLREASLTTLADRVRPEDREKYVVVSEPSSDDIDLVDMSIISQAMEDANEECKVEEMTTEFSQVTFPPTSSPVL